MKKLTTASLAIAMLTLLSLSGYGQVLINDTFSLNGDDRTPGAKLLYTSAETNNAPVPNNTEYGSIDGSSGALFGTRGGLVPYTNPKNGYVDINGFMYYEGTGALNESLTINFGGTDTNPTAGSPYEFLAFGAGGSPYGVGGYLSDDGTVALFDDTVQAPVSVGTVANFSLSGTYTLTLNYDQATQTVSALVNGVQIVAPVSIEGKGFTAEPVLGDFFGSDLAATPNVLVSGFNVSEGTVTAPEPSTYALLLAGLGFVGLVARKRWAGLTV